MTQSIASLAVMLSARSQTAAPAAAPAPAVAPVPAVAAPPPLSEAEVEDFVRQYVAATNEADASRIMSMVSREPEVCSVGPGRVSQGWDAIRAATEEATASRGRFEVTLGTIEVTLLGPDAALAVAAMLVNNAAGAATIVVKRTAEGLRLIHEHYSLRPGSQTLLP